MIGRWWSVLWVVLAVLWAAVGHAGADGHGATPFPDDGDPADPIWGWRPELARPGVPSFGVTFDAALAPLVREVQVGSDVEEEVLLGDYLALDLAGTVGVASRLSIGLSLPVFLAAGTIDGPGPPAFGDLTLVAPVGIVLPNEDGSGFGLGLAPTLRLPTGSADRWVGDGGVGGGGSLAAGWGGGRFHIAGSVGVQTRAWPKLESDPTHGGVEGDADLGLSVRVFDPLTLHLEARGTTSPVQGVVPPIEALLGARGAVGRGLWWVGGVATGLTAGVSASAFRAYAGIGYTPPRPVVGPDRFPGPIRLYVADPRGGPVSDAVVEAAGAPVGRTDAVGFFAADAQTTHGALSISAQGYQGIDVLAQADDEVHVVLPWEPIPARAHVQAQDGEALGAAVVTWGSPAAEWVGSEVALEPGEWTVAVTAEGYGAQIRTVVVEPGQRPIDVDVILGPVSGEAELTLAVRGPGEAVDADVQIDGVPFGATGSGGTLTLAGLPAGTHLIGVEADGWQAVEQEFALQTGPNAVSVYLRRAPGSVKVVARGPDGPVGDALVRFDGPSRLPPWSLGDDGERVVQVRPGTWSVLVLSPSYGLQSRVVVVPEEAVLTVVDVFLQPEEGGDADLVVQVVDPDGQPVSGASVLLDGQSLGRTSSGGTVAVEQLAVGPRLLQVRRDWFRDEPPIDLFLVAGVQERVVTMEWLPGTVRVVARSAEGAIEDAVARFSGPAAVTPLPLGPPGEAFTSLPPGAWKVLVVSEQWGLQERDVVVQEDSTTRIDVDVVLGGLHAGPADLVVVVTGPEGKAVEHAQVAIDGAPVGDTSTAGTMRLEGMAIGPVTVTVTTPLYETATVPMILTDGEQTAFASLRYAVGATRLVTRTATEPVTDAVIRLSGPSKLPPMTVDGTGERLLALSPGRWQVLAVSATHGLVEQRFTVGDERGLRLVDLVLESVPAGTTSLVLRIQDPDGRAIEGAVVRRDGEKIGATAAGGALVVDGLKPGALALSVEAPRFEAARVEGDVREGTEERLVVLRWVPRTVRVEVRDANGRPVQAELSAEGPEDVPHALADESGHAVLALRPGSWQVVAAAPGLGTAALAVTVEPGADPESLSFVLAGSLVDLTRDQVVIREKVHFDFDRATIRAESNDVLAQVAATVLGHPGIVRVEVQGHTDATGGAAYNLDLSERRAQAVVDALVALGVAPERLVAHGYGLARPVADAHTEAGRAENRRVQFEILEWTATP